MSVIEVERRSPATALLTLNRPERLNALSYELVEALHLSLEELAADPACRVIIITGAGRGFCSGIDLKGAGEARTARGKRGAPAALRSQEYIANLVTRIHRQPQMVIAAINGPAFGGGFALAAASDFRLAASSARFGVQFIKIGVSGCDIGISYLLPRLIGWSRATELIATAREFDADEALRTGFVTGISPDEQLLEDAYLLAEVLCAHSPFALELTKQVINANMAATSLEAAIHLENRTQVLASTTGSVAEAAAAFVEKRSPVWPQ